MTQDPTPYDLLQDAAIEGLQEIVTPYYTPPGDAEYSFPVVGQGITADQYRLMSLGQANGIIHGDNGVVNDSPNSTGYRYYLEGHATDAETNQRNTLMLRAGTSAEAILEGFYHRLSEDMELSFPAVSTPTTYHVCLTYDPRREDEPTGPIHVEVYAGEPPTTHGRVHVILHTVERQPNQLLSQATRTRYRPYTAGVVSIQTEAQLPDVNSYPAGTLAVPSGAEARGIFVRSNTHPRRWANTMVGPWEQCRPATGWAHSATPLEARMTVMGIQLRGVLNGEAGQPGASMARLPASWPLMNREYRFHLSNPGRDRETLASIGGVSGDRNLIRMHESSSQYSTFPRFDGIIIPTN